MDNQSFIKIYNENDISWKLQNEIHKTLNVAFEGISTKFIAKTYADTRPLERAIGFDGETIIAHLGISRDVIVLDDSSINVACLGLWASSRNGWATKIINASLDYLKAEGALLAIGKSNNPIILKRVLPRVNCKVLDFRIKGKNHLSKLNDQAILFPLNISEQEFNKVIDEINNKELILIEGEPF